MLFLPDSRRAGVSDLSREGAPAALDQERTKATINKAKTSNYGSPIGRGVPPGRGRHGKGARKD